LIVPNENRNVRLRQQLASRIYNACYQESTEHFDEYMLASDPVLLEDIAYRMIFDVIESITHIKPFDSLASMETSGIPIVVALSNQLTRPAMFVRKEPSFGKYIEGGPLIKGERVLIVENVTVADTYLFDAIARLRGDGAKVSDAICVIDDDSAKDRLWNRSRVKLWPLYTWTELKEAVDG
jgi:orotate phosphoribosyltransferase